MIEKLRVLVSAEYKLVDRSLLGVGRPQPKTRILQVPTQIWVWKTMSDSQCQRVVKACFRLLLPTETSMSTDSGLHVMYLVLR